MWDILFNNIPLTIIVILAVIICGAELIKAIGIWKNKIDEHREKKNIGAAQLKSIEASLKSLHAKVDKQDERLDSFDQKIKDLTTSDMHDIKAWIVKQYHTFYVEQGWINAFDAETIDLRYEDYKKEGGNSYIDTLIERLHTLPMDPPDINRR